MPPIPIVVRYVAKPVDIAGWSPPIGTFLAPCSYLAHRDPEVFPEPDAFRPERFLDAKPPPWVYFPYGGGARLCLGSTFAHFEMVNILATILQSVNLSLTGPAVARPVRATITIRTVGWDSRADRAPPVSAVRTARTRKVTRLGRISDYLALTFPPAPMLLAAAISFAAVYFLLEALALHTRLAYTWSAVGAMLTCYYVSLLLRIYDELKDVETDRRLAAAGDRKYVERPIVRGLVDKEDLRGAPLGGLRARAHGELLRRPGPLRRLLRRLSRGVDVLSLVLPAKDERQLDARISHAQSADAAPPGVRRARLRDGLRARCALRVADPGDAPRAAGARGRVGIARKVRAPEDETDYVTYSKVLGWRTASLLPMAAVTVSTGCVLWVARPRGSIPLYLAAVALGAAVVFGAIARFRVAPSARTAKLRPFVEGLAAVVNVGGVIALAVRWGVTLGAGEVAAHGARRTLRQSATLAMRCPSPPTRAGFPSSRFCAGSETRTRCSTSVTRGSGTRSR